MDDSQTVTPLLHCFLEFEVARAPRRFQEPNPPAAPGLFRPGCLEAQHRILRHPHEAWIFHGRRFGFDELHLELLYTIYLVSPDLVNHAWL